jgi:hypothetical protein
MKYIITETQLDSTLTSLKRGTTTRGKLSDVIEELTFSYFSDIQICDVVAPYSNDSYIILVLTSDYISEMRENKLEKHIESLVGADNIVVTLQNQNCKPVER